MKKINHQPAVHLFLITVICITITTQLKSQPKNDSAKTFLTKSDSLNKAMMEYQKMLEDMQKNQTGFRNESSNQFGSNSKMFGISLDLIGGYCSSNAEIERNINAAGNIPATSNNGLFAGANVTLTLLSFSLTSGLSYSSKGFKTSNDDQIDMNYFNIPLLFTFNFNVGKIYVEPSIGPYAGIMLSNKNDSLLSNIDIGVTGSLQGTYMFQKHFGALMGFKYEHGGLKNFSDNENASNVKTRSWVLYSGIKIVF